MREFLKKFTGHFLPGESNSYRPHLLRKPWLLFFLTVVLTAEGIYAGALVAGQSANNFLSAVLPGEVIALTNNERAQAGDGTLAENAQLDAAAQAKANDMAVKGYFSHVGPDGKEPWAWISESGYVYSYAGENLAVRFTDSADVVNAWMASPTHKANIVKPQYTEIGLGVADGMYEGSPATFVVQYFGTPQTPLPARAASAAPAAAASAPVSDASPSSAPEVAGAQTQNPPVKAYDAPTTTRPSAASPGPSEQSSISEQAPVRSEVQTFLRASETTKNSTNWIIGGIAGLILLVIGLTVLVHVQIQPTQLVLGGAFVGAVAVSLLFINHSILGAAGSAQSASVLTAQGGALIDSAAAATQAP